jgi:hypothetical protein
MRTSILTFVAVSYLSAAPAIGTPAASPASIPANASTLVTVTTQIADPAVIASGVNLLQVNSAGGSPVILGVMHDDGKNGDAVAGDGIFTLQISFSPATPGMLYLEVSAAFKGALQRVPSGIISLNIR